MREIGWIKKICQTNFSFRLPGKSVHNYNVGVSQNVMVTASEPRPCILNYALKVHKIEIFSGSDFEFSTISLLVLLKY
jgi:hypothetical protein